MIMDSIRLILAIISLFFIGYVPVYFLLLKDHSSALKFRSISGRAFVFFISFYTGMLIASIYLMILSQSGFEYNLASTGIFSAVFFIASVFLFTRKEISISRNKLPGVNNGKNLYEDSGKYNTYEAKESEDSSKWRKPGRKSGNTIFYFFVFLIFLNFLVVLFLALLFPIRFWDAIACWSLKGRAFFIDAGIMPFFENHDYQFAHLTYPLYLPLMQTWVYTWMGKINENMVKIIFPLFYLSGLFIFYYLFRKKYSRLMAIIYVFIFSALPAVMDHGYIEYTNLLFAIILMIAAWFFYSYIRCITRQGTLLPQGLPASAPDYKSISYLLLSTIFFVILAQVRSEGLLYLTIFLIVNLVIGLILIVRINKVSKVSMQTSSPDWTKNFYAKIIAAIASPVLFSLLLMSVWMFLKYRLNIGFLSEEWQDIFTTELFSFSQAFKALFSELVFSAFDSTRAYLGSSFGVLWMILFILFILNIKKMFKNFRWIFFIFIAAGFISLLFSLGAITDFTWSTDRYILHLLPLTYFWILYSLPA